MRDLEQELREAENGTNSQSTSSPTSRQGSMTNIWKKVSWNKSDSEEEPLLAEHQESSIKVTLDEASNAVHETIGKMLGRGESIHDIKGKASKLENVGDIFRKRTKKVYNKSWWSLFKHHFFKGSLAFLLIVIVLFFLFVLFRWMWYIVFPYNPGYGGGYGYPNPGQMPGMPNGGANRGGSGQMPGMPSGGGGMPSSGGGMPSSGGGMPGSYPSYPQTPQVQCPPVVCSCSCPQPAYIPQFPPYPYPPPSQNYPVPPVQIPPPLSTPTSTTGK
ncbi:hypothetical protein HK103_004752 [Boothiomyces macroporosus]|uniref:V-SNARE coiled-coil homology domain-containing protein n=1 Tax=Boothiomyces macroporosus TaxID=261099 RepID=A0AAD5UQX8_9FUNG|nr:hypothetical protein HK103_004752 [Boothiomyces macroporosus]